MKHLKYYKLFESRSRIKDYDVNQLLKDIELEYDIKIKVKSNLGEQRGYAICDKNTVVISDKLLSNVSSLFKTVLHEAGHIHCTRKGIFKNYHRPTRIDIEDMSPELKSNIIKIGLKAERYVDRWAASELYKWNKRLKYDYRYSKPDIHKKYNNLYLSQFR